jgi:hypothetical protein
MRNGPVAPGPETNLQCSNINWEPVTASRILLVVCKAGWGLALDMDTCVQILDEFGFLPAGQVGLVSLIGIPEGLDAGQTERFLRENGGTLEAQTA